MRKRPRRRRPKRSGANGAGQRRQKLSRRVRELYRPDLADDPEAAEWHAELEGELARPGRGRGRQKTRSGERASDEAGVLDERDDEQATGSESTGRVIAISSGSCRVQCGEEALDCVLPSDLARNQRAVLAVGDRVAFATHGASHRLRRVLPRRTVLSRPDPRNPRDERVIAANIDIAVHVESVAQPPLRPALVDRYLIAIARGGADAAVCVNKMDLLSGTEERLRELAKLAPYRALGLSILPCSAKTGEGLDDLHKLLAKRTAVFVGHSGVGKSSILNALAPGLDADTGAVTRRSGTGRHTTTRSSLYRLEDGIRVIDTPGIREFGLWQLTEDELAAYFADFEEHAARCRFRDCAHTHEPDCGVRAAVEAGELSAARHEAYLRIRASLASGD